MRILLVEDHLDSADMLARLLRGSGHELTMVHSGEDALAACHAQSFDLLISDIGLPGMDGWELLARVREHCDVPAIALTAFGLAADVARSQSAGFAAHLSKPVSFPDLEAEIARLTASAGAPTAPR